MRSLTINGHEPQYSFASQNLLRNYIEYKKRKKREKK